MDGGALQEEQTGPVVAWRAVVVRGRALEVEEMSERQAAAPCRAAPRRAVPCHEDAR